MRLIGIFALGVTWMMAVDLVGAWQSVRGGIDYLLWLPVTLLGYAVFGAMAWAAGAGEYLSWVAGGAAMVETVWGAMIAHRMGAQPSELSDRRELLQLSILVAPLVGLLAAYLARMGAEFLQTL